MSDGKLRCHIDLAWSSLPPSGGSGLAAYGQAFAFAGFIMSELKTNAELWLISSLPLGRNRRCALSKVSFSLHELSEMKPVLKPWIVWVQYAPNLFNYELLITLDFCILNMAWMAQALPGVRWWQALSHSFQTFGLFKSDPRSVTRQCLTAGGWIRLGFVLVFFPAVELRYCALCTVTLDLIGVNLYSKFTSEISQRRSVWFESKAYAISCMFSTGLHVYVPMTSNSLQRLAQCRVYASCCVLMQMRF